MENKFLSRISDYFNTGKEKVPSMTEGIPVIPYSPPLPKWNRSLSRLFQVDNLKKGSNQVIESM